MKPENELKLGAVLWVIGFVGCMLTSFYITKNAYILYSISGSSLAMGLVLIWCGAFDMFCDEFEDEVKNSYFGEGR